MSHIPKRFQEFMASHPEIAEAYTALGDATLKAGPLDAKTASLVKIGISAGAKMEGALRSHVRKALEAGATAAEIRHAILLTATTIGFPNMMAALSWSEEVLPRGE